MAAHMGLFMHLLVICISSFEILFMSFHNYITCLIFDFSVSYFNINLTDENNFFLSVDCPFTLLIITFAKIYIF